MGADLRQHGHKRVIKIGLYCQDGRVSGVVKTLRRGGQGVRDFLNSK